MGAEPAGREPCRRAAALEVAQGQGQGQGKGQGQGQEQEQEQEEVSQAIVLARQFVERQKNTPESITRGGYSYGLADSSVSNLNPQACGRRALCAQPACVRSLLHPDA